MFFVILVGYMLTKVFSAAVIGIDATQVEIEIHTGSGDPAIIVVGLPDMIVRESKDRVIAAISNSAYRWSLKRTTVNLAPADIKKQGPSFDLPIAIGLIAQAQSATLPRLEHCYLAGELALNGEIRPIKGALALTLEARAQGKKAILLPLANVREAAVVDGIEVYGVRNLREAYEFLSMEKNLSPAAENPSVLLEHQEKFDVDFAEVKGQQQVKRAIEVAVAGGHNLLLIGPPGSGKSMLARRIPSIMPPLSLEEALETTKIHSVCGLMAADVAVVMERPFRDPHHTISDVGLLGGSANITPGEISIAHHGVLFLDELPEFHRSTLEVLRQPLEDAKVTISRASGTMTFPAAFMLVAAMNPCPCGYYGDLNRTCRCSPLQRERYRQRISGPLLDRIDLHVEAPAIAYKELAATELGEPSEAIRKRVVAARQLQEKRFATQQKTRSLLKLANASKVQGASDAQPHSVHEVHDDASTGATPQFAAAVEFSKRSTKCNARMTPTQLREYCSLKKESQELLRKAITDLNFSARAYDRILKVARTIADLAHTENIETEHLLEALSYRSLDRKMWN